MCCAWDETIIYEVHVKGFTARHPDIPEALRGTYSGLVAPPALDYLRRLGVTAVELLPIHQFASDKHLEDWLINAHWEPIAFVLPAHQRSVRWEPVLDTRESDGQPRTRPCAAGRPICWKRAPWFFSV